MAISPQITNLVIILGMMQVSKRIPMEDPQALMIIRGIYILSNVLILSVYAYTHYLINKKKGAFYHCIAMRKPLLTRTHRYDNPQVR